MFEDVKIYTSHNQDMVEKLIMKYSALGYYLHKFKTDIVYSSFNRDGDHSIYYTLLFVKYKEEPIENVHVTINSTEDFTYATPIDVTEIGGEGELSTVTEQVHSKKGGRSKKGENPEKEVSTITDSSSVHED